MDRMAKQDELVFLPLGGSGEIGMNFNAYGFGPENNRQWIIVDCGVLFGREGHTPGVDLIMLETFRDLDELREAVLAVREAAGREMPLIAQVAIEDDGTLEDGTSAANIALALTQWPVDVIGLNCSSGPRVLLEAIEAMAPHTGKPLSVMPNAGLPVTVEGRNLYLCSPEYMAQYARRFLEAGAKGSPPLPRRALPARYQIPSRSAATA